MQRILVALQKLIGGALIGADLLRHAIGDAVDRAGDGTGEISAEPGAVGVPTRADILAEIAGDEVRGDYL